MGTGRFGGQPSLDSRAVKSSDMARRLSPDKCCSSRGWMPVCPAADLGGEVKRTRRSCSIVIGP
eukprot:1973776-Pyramimonas_sp.AAC.1